MNFTTFITIPFILTSLIAPAKAAPHADYCQTHEGYEICGWKGDRHDRLTVRGDAFVMDINVRCTETVDEYAWEWEVNEVAGPITDDDLSDYAQQYCIGRLGIEDDSPTQDQEPDVARMTV